VGGRCKPNTILFEPTPEFWRRAVGQLHSIWLRVFTVDSFHMELLDCWRQELSESIFSEAAAMCSAM